jgi:hypothetical protein
VPASALASMWTLEEERLAQWKQRGGEHNGEVRGKLGLAEEGRSNFEKTDFRTLTDPANNAVDGTVEKVDSAHCAVGEMDC